MSAAIFCDRRASHCECIAASKGQGRFWRYVGEDVTPCEATAHCDGNRPNPQIG